MAERLYYLDAYLKEFEATVAAVKNERIFLDRTCFYPGGGGQQSDLGEIEGMRVSEVGKENEDIYHSVPGSSFSVGQKVKCRIDWGRRYELMRGHTGQHILFRAMQEQNPELTVAKVDIGIDKKSLFFNGEFSWDMLSRALARTNEIIASDLEVRTQEVPRDSPELKEVRIKAERISDETVRIVRIGDFDAAACGGVHVRRTGEIGGLAIIRLISGRQASDWEIQFEIGFKGLTRASQLALTTISLSNTLVCPPENVEATVRNLRARVDDLTDKLKKASQKQLDNLVPEKIGFFSFYSALLTGADRKTLNDYAARLIRQDGAVVLFCDVSENAYMIVGCNERLSLDCPAILKIGLEMLKGKGGGKKYFAQGGGSQISSAEDAFKTVKQSIIDRLSSEFSCG
ncbi:MAG: DHHA1 domain-containing protein [Thermoplasmata archaeon]